MTVPPGSNLADAQHLGCVIYHLSRRPYNGIEGEN